MFSLNRYARANPIAARLLGLIILGSSLVTLITILLQLYGNFHDDIAMLEKRLDQVRVSTLASITKSLWGFDQEQLNIQINSVLDVQDVVHVSVQWSDWNNSEQMIVAGKPGYSAAEIDQKPNQFLIITYPLIYEDASTPPQQLGTLTITASLASIYDKLWERALFIAGVQGTKTLLVALFILWLVHTLLTRHMDTIARYARQLNLENLNVPLRLKRIKVDSNSDELDNVVNAINHMRETLLEDIEHRRAIELALLSEKEEKLETHRQKIAAEDASRAKSQFLATMSHEIRTPMNGVIGMLEMLRDTPLNDNQRHYIDVIHRSGETLLDIINDILDYSKIEANKMQLEIAVFDLEELIEDCIQLFGATASKHHIELLGGVAPGTPLLLKGDSTRLRQIIINLLGNAFKFTEQGFISLEASLAPDSTDGNLLRFAVADSGIGINSTAHPNLFDSFNQADTSTTRKYGGTGLGLAICKNLAELMGGEIGVYSKRGKGSTFWFTAAFSVINETPDTPQHDPRLQNLLYNKNLLLIGGSKKFRKFLSAQCTSWGVNVHWVATKEQMHTHLQEMQKQDKQVDFVALDYQPSESLLEVVEWMHQEPAYQHIPALVLSNNDLPQDNQAWRALKIHAVLRKPLSAKTFKLKLAAMLGLDVSPPPIQKSDYNYDQYAHLHVLVAEDNAVNRMVIKGLLGKLQIQPQLVENGLAAYNALRETERPYDLIFMDCEMPEMDGFEATRRIREYERDHNLNPTPIVALTAHALPEHRDAVFACGMNHYLSKPVTLDSLYTTLEKIDLRAAK
jgi:signal transduction histidine kinase/CheY-like chemotaxis protein